MQRLRTIFMWIGILATIKIIVSFIKDVMFASAYLNMPVWELLVNFFSNLLMRIWQWF